MDSITVEHLYKTFGETKAVQDVTFSVRTGEILGLIGPNGAGKTTIIRLILDILKPDAGRVNVLGGMMDEEKMDLIGYMPEERGLYQDDELERCLTYMGTLKGLPAGEVKQRLERYFDSFDLTEHRKKKVKELSKGMQQKAQIINTVLHDPQLIIIDEPFTALDPVNTRMVKEIMLDLRAEGKTIIMSTHQMNQVEALCDRIVLIDHGKMMLYGDLEEIRRQFSGRDLLVKTGEPFPDLKGVEHVTRQDSDYRVTLAPDYDPQTYLEALVTRKIRLEKFELALPSVDEIFIRVVKGEAGDE
jgi:ABC-2 type transport system ATP-binding protein